MNISSNQGESDSKTRLRLWIKMLRYTRETEAILRESLRTEFESTLPRFDVLATLHHFGDGMKMSELSDHLLVSNGSATVVVDRLVKEGFVERKAVPKDRRALTVHLTKRGRKHFLQQAIEHEKWVDGLLGGISANDADRMMKLIDTKLRKR